MDYFIYKNTPVNKARIFPEKNSANGNRMLQAWSVFRFILKNKISFRRYTAHINCPDDGWMFKPKPCKIWQSPKNIKHKCSVLCVYLCICIHKKGRKEEITEVEISDVFCLNHKRKKKLKWKRKKERIMWFVACYIERERKRTRTNCRVSSRNSRLTWELK